MERRKKFNCFFFKFASMDDFSSKIEKNKGDRDFKQNPCGTSGQSHHGLNWTIRFSICFTFSPS